MFLFRLNGLTHLESSDIILPSHQPHVITRSQKTYNSPLAPLMFPAMTPSTEMGSESLNIKVNVAWMFNSGPVVDLIAIVVPKLWRYAVSENCSFCTLVQSSVDMPEGLL